MLDYQKIGQRIRALRRAKNLSQEQLAEKIWISTTHMSHIETGSTKLSLPVLVDIAAALNVSTDEILGGPAPGDGGAAQLEIASVLSTCSPSQAALIARIVRSAKEAMDEYF